MSAMRPTVLKGFVLNDIGPRVEGIGLLRLAGQLTRLPDPRSWDDAVETLRTVQGKVFTNLDDGEWSEFAREIFRDKNGKPVVDFDRKIARKLDPDAISAGETPELWPQFDGLGGIPGLVIRGENSDILTERTVAEMKKRHHRLSAVTVAERGHAPFLIEPEALKGIESLLGRIDAS